MTKFQVLFSEQVGQWKTGGIEEAHNADAACKSAYLKNPRNILAVVAVPLRSWRPTPIRSEPQPPKVHLGEPVVEKQEQA